jgi:hypothetical protein
LVLLAAPTGLTAAPAGAEGTLARPEARDAIPDSIPGAGARLTGKEIYQRYIENKFSRSHQNLRVISRDPGGSEQLTRFEARLEDFRNEADEPVDGVVFKMLIGVSAPPDMRHTAYLIISKDPGPDDEFAYQPSRKRIRRLDLKNTSLFGTDYSFNDISFQKIEDADYERLPDEVIDGVPVYVVEANVKQEIDVQYHRTISYLETEHYVPLRTRYWDDFGVEIKELIAPHEKIRAFGDTWVATETTMTDLRQNTNSSIYVDHLDTEPVFHRMTFSVTRLAHGH